MNVLLGPLEKKMNNNIDCKLSVQKEEAQYYIEQSGSKIGELSHHEELPVPATESLFADGSSTQSTQQL